jgi:hypothetical protein
MAQAYYRYQGILLPNIVISGPFKTKDEAKDATGPSRIVIKQGPTIFSNNAPMSAKQKLAEVFRALATALYKEQVLHYNVQLLDQSGNEITTIGPDVIGPPENLRTLGHGYQGLKRSNMRESIEKAVADLLSGSSIDEAITDLL